LDKRRRRLGLTLGATIVGTLLVLPSLRAAELTPELKKVLGEAQSYQKEAQEKGDYALYIKAWEKYQHIRKADRNPPREVIDGCQFCLRRVQQAHRLREKPLQGLTADLDAKDALNIYVDVLTKLQKRYFDGTKVGLADLFQYGVQEMRFALEDEAFLREQIRPDVKPEAVQALRDELEGIRPAIKKPADARDQLQRVMLEAGALGARPTAVLVEFVSGACNALDEYTGYLSPRRLAEVEADLNGKFVGIGVSVAYNGKQLVIRDVYADSPAYMKLFAKDVILTIDEQKADPAKLDGEEGTTVVLEVRRPSEGMTYKVEVARRPVAVPSVDVETMPNPYGVGYVRLYSFQKSTPQEMRSALMQLRSQPTGLKSLILDLRGNQGGSFDAALQVAELFLSEGVIVYTNSRMKETPRRANNPDAFTVPLVVLVDGDTASAAEVVAGALKDNKRATVVGQATFGKGSIQCLVPLDRLKAGLQVTVARFSSPERVPYDGHGVTPHHVVENSMMMMGDAQQKTAYELAKQMAEEMGMALPMPPPR